MADRKRKAGTKRESRTSRSIARLIGIASLELDDGGILESRPFDAKNSADIMLVRSIERTLKRIDQPTLEARLREHDNRILIASVPSQEDRFLMDDLLSILKNFLGQGVSPPGESLAFGICVLISYKENKQHNYKNIDVSEKAILDLIDKARLPRLPHPGSEGTRRVDEGSLPAREAVITGDLPPVFTPEERSAFALIEHRLRDDPSNNRERLIAIDRLVRSVERKPPSGDAEGTGVEAPAQRANSTGREPVRDGGVPEIPGPGGSAPIAPQSEVEEVLDIGRSLCEEFDGVNIPRIPRVQSFLDRLASVDFQKTSRETRDETVRVVKDLISRAGAIEVFCFDSDDKDQPWKLATEILCVTSSLRSLGAFRFRDRDREEIHKRIDWPPCRIEPVGGSTRS